MIIWFYGLSYLLMMVVPIALGAWIHHARGASWRYFFMGAVTFVASQVLHLPFNWLVLQRWQLIPSDTAVFTNLLALAVFGGLSAGVFEEGARYVTYRFWAKDARTWGRGLMLGAGHGGVESLLLGVLAAISVASLWFTANNAVLLNALPADQAELVRAQAAAVFDVPPYMGLMPVVERLATIPTHLALSLMVMQVFTRGRLRWLWLAILWHALLDATAVISAVTWGVVVTEVLLVVLALAGVGIIFALRTPEPEPPLPEPLPPPAGAPVLPPAAHDDALDRSRYS